MATNKTPFPSKKHGEITHVTIGAMTLGALLDVFNEITGRGLKAFRDKGIAQQRTLEALTGWQAALPANNKVDDKPKAPRLKLYPASKTVQEPRRGSRREVVLALMGRRGGATGAEMMKAAKWNERQFSEALRILNNRLGFGIKEVAEDDYRLISTDGETITWKPTEPKAEDK